MKCRSASFIFGRRFDSRSSCAVETAGAREGLYAEGAGRCHGTDQDAGEHQQGGARSGEPPAQGGSCRESRLYCFRISISSPLRTLPCFEDGPYSSPFNGANERSRIVQSKISIVLVFAFDGASAVGCIRSQDLGGRLPFDLERENIALHSRLAVKW